MGFLSIVAAGQQPRRAVYVECRIGNVARAKVALGVTELPAFLANLQRRFGLQHTNRPLQLRTQTGLVVRDQQFAQLPAGARLLLEEVVETPRNAEAVPPTRSTQPLQQASTQGDAQQPPGHQGGSNAISTADLLQEP